MNKKLEVGDTFTAKGGLEMEVIERKGSLLVCLHRALNWRGYYHADGEYVGPVAPPAPNLHADFYDASKVGA